MNILYLTHRIPYPPNKGDKLRAFHQLAYLARKHRIWCACFVDDPADLAHVDAVSRECEALVALPLRPTWSTLRGLGGALRGGTITEAYYHSPAMAAALQHWCSSVSFDAVVAFSSSMAQYALQVPAGQRVLDLCDLDSQKWLDYARNAPATSAWLYRREGQRLARKEAQWIEAFDATLLITAEEAAGLTPAPTPGKLHIVGNGVPLPKLAETQPDSTPVVGFMGMMDYKPNVDAVCWFAHKCWPAIRAACPQAVFRIVGRRPTRAVRRLSRLEGVEVTGAVPEAAAEVARFSVSVVPLRIARGLQNKVLEAMAAAKPVVLTPQAATGIAARNGHEFIVADTVESLAASVVRLLQDPAACLRFGTAARAFVARCHRWDDELAKFEAVVTGGQGETCAEPAALASVTAGAEFLDEAEWIPARPRS